MRVWCRVALLIASLLISCVARGAAEPFVDPAPPVAQKLDAQPPAEAKENPDATFHAAPKPLAADAVTQDWPWFLGPDHNNVCKETHLVEAFDAKGPPRVWEMTKGSGYSSPVVAGERLVLLHRVDDNEVVDCLQPGTGKRFWRFTYPTQYQDRYGYSDGPRGTPAIDAKNDSVFTYGAEGKLHCLELSTGRVKWKRDVLKEFRIRQNFFGVGSSPLLEGENVILNVGAEPNGPCVAAFDGKTGRLAWGAGKQWGPSYASPIPATLRGRRRVLVFAGGESDPATGGLLAVDARDGAVDFSFPWRGDRRESVNASSPVVLGDDRILVSEAYGAGGAMLRANPNGAGAETLWTNASFGTHFMSAVEKDGYLYGVDGHGPHDAFLVCVDAKSGKETWRTQPEWTETITGKSGVSRKATMGTYRAWLVPVEGGKRFLCTGEFGHLLWVELTPAGYKERSRSWIFAAGESWTPPVISRGLLYLCQNSSDAAAQTSTRLICLDLRK